RPIPTLEGAEAQRLLDCQGLLAAIDQQFQTLGQTAAINSLDMYATQALNLVTSPAARLAFDLSRENCRTRDRYGRTAFGQGCLLARRLVEAGIRLVTVNWARDDAFWDTHANNFT